jgi:hypothetical protein
MPIGIVPHLRKPNNQEAVSPTKTISREEFWIKLKD